MWGREKDCFGSTWERGGLPVTSTTLVVAHVEMSRWVIVGGDRWGWPLPDPPSLLAKIVCAFLSGNWHLTGLLRAAESSVVWIVFFPSLLSGLPEKGELGAEGASRDPCTGGAKDPLAKGESLLLVGAGNWAPPPLGFDLHLNLPKPCRALRLAFRILSAIRKNSLNMEIWRSSNSERIFIFIIEKRLRIDQERVYCA